jgi:hypothetical protein
VPAEFIDLRRPEIAAAMAAPATAASLRQLAAVLARVSREDLRALRATLAGAEGRTADEIADDIEREAPSLGNVAGWLRSKSGMALAVRNEPCYTV